MAQTMTIKAIGFEIVGLAALLLWDDSEGTIPMKPVRLRQEDFPTIEQIREAVNDNGFGCQRIEGAVVRVDTLYEYGARTYGDAQFVNMIKDCHDSHVLKLLSIGHPDCAVNIWELDDATLAKADLQFAAC